MKTIEELLTLRPKEIWEAIEDEFDYFTEQDRKRLYDKANYYASIIEEQPRKKQDCIAAMKYTIKSMLHKSEYLLKT